MSADNESVDGQEKDKKIDDLGYKEASIEIDDLPARGSPEQFLIATEHLKEGGSREVGELADDIEEYGSTNLSGNLKLGEMLEFLQRTGEGVSLTDSGYRLAFAVEEGEDINELFTDGLRKARPYLQLLRGLSGESRETYDTLIKNSDLLQVMRTEFGMTDASEGKLKRSISILFETLEEAGYGERKEAGGDYPTRFSFTGDWTLESMLRDLISSQEATTEEGRLGDRTDEKPSLDSEKTDGETPVDEEEDDNDEELVDRQKVEETIKQKNETIPSTYQEVSVTVNIELDMNDMDTAEFEKKLEFLKDLL